MEHKQKKRLVPYDMLSPGFEAVYTGEKSSSPFEKTELITTLTTDKTGHILRRWSVFTWTFPGQEKDWDDEIAYLNEMQAKLGPLDDNIRQVRAHIGSLVPCDSGFPVTVDELLEAIGRGWLQEPSFRNGCWCPGMWWELKTSQPHHLEGMKIIHALLTGYLEGKSREDFIGIFPHVEGFINHTYEWLGPASKLTEIQRLMMNRMLLTVEFFSKTSDTIPHSFWLDQDHLQEGENAAKNLFEEGGQGIDLDTRISEKAGLPKIYPRWNPKFRETLDKLKDPQKKDLYRTCSAIASGVHTLSDCHHNTFRNIEAWIHGIGTERLEIPTRQSGTERRRLGHLLLGYVLGLDRWLLGSPMPFVLMELGHKDLGFDPRNEVLRVYAYLGDERTPVKEWLAACLWHSLSYHYIDEEHPCGLVRHKDLLEHAAHAGVSGREWMDSALCPTTG